MEAKILPDFLANKKLEFENRLNKNQNYTDEEKVNIINSLNNIWNNVDTYATDWDQQQYIKIINAFDSIYNDYVSITYPEVVNKVFDEFGKHPIEIKTKITPIFQPSNVYNPSRLFYKSFILEIPRSILEKKEKPIEYTNIAGENIANYSNTAQIELIQNKNLEEKELNFTKGCACIKDIEITQFLASGLYTSVFECIYQGNNCVIKFTKYNSKEHINEFSNIMNIFQLAKSNNIEFIPKLYMSCICKTSQDTYAITITERIKYTKAQVYCNYLMPLIESIKEDDDVKKIKELAMPYFDNIVKWEELVTNKLYKNLLTLKNYNILCADIFTNEKNTMYMDDLLTGLNNPNFIAYIVDFGECDNNKDFYYSDVDYIMNTNRIQLIIEQTQHSIFYAMFRPHRKNQNIKKAWFELAKEKIHY